MKSNPNELPETTPKKPSNLDRRKFMTGLALGAGLSPLAAAFRKPLEAVPAPAAASNLCYSTAKPLLTQADVAFLGYYDVQTNGNDTTYSRGLAIRRVNGDLRFLYLQLGGDLHEFSLAGRSYGDRITSVTNRYPLGGVGIWDFTAFWFEESTQRLWSTTAIDYTATTYPVQIFTRTLNPDGTVSNVRGPIGLQGVNAKRVYGGAMALPPWFQQQYGVGPYAVGMGGYTSLMSQGGGASLGPAIYAIPDPSGFSPNSEIPTSKFKKLSDYGDTGNRGSRITIPVNYYDGGDPRQNPTTRPTAPPLSSAGWLSPAADGTGRWVWGDHYEGAVFVDGPSKSGVIMLAQVATGSAWYANSTLNSDGRAGELHVYDPAQFGAVALGQRAIDSVRPTSMRQLTEIRQAWTSFTGNGTMFSTAYDTQTNRLYVLVFAGGPDVYTARLLVYAVNA